MYETHKKMHHELVDLHEKLVEAYVVLGKTETSEEKKQITTHLSDAIQITEVVSRDVEEFLLECPESA